jgi:putative DNA methylase
MVKAGWRTRGYLPHYDAEGEAQHVVFRLFDSLPANVFVELERAPPNVRFDTAEGLLDRGVGSRALRDSRIATIVREALLHDDLARYRLLAWCVMPTHVHVLMQPSRGGSLAGIVQAWKSVSARRANLVLGRSGPFWSREYFDRAMRNDRQMAATWAYIEANPVSAGLCATPQDWPWSSACAWSSGPPAPSPAGSAPLTVQNSPDSGLAAGVLAAEAAGGPGASCKVSA